MNDDQITGFVPYDPYRAAQANRYDYLLGGKDNSESDRTSAAELQKIFPDAATAAVENRKFIVRVVTYLRETLGITQFLDIGCGMPNGRSVFAIAGYDARVVFVDHNELVGVYARALMLDTPYTGGTQTAFILGDLRRPDTFLADPDLTGTLDLTKPVAVVIGAVLHFIPDDQHPHDAVRTVMDAMPAGSYLAASIGTGDFMSAEQNEAFNALPRDIHGPLVSRTKAEITRFFDGLHLPDPGLVPTAEWHPEPEHATAAQCAAYAGLAVKP
jgi:hypothetical protein